MSPERKKEREKNALYSGQLRLCQQPRAAHALRSDQNDYKPLPAHLTHAQTTTTRVQIHLYDRLLHNLLLGYLHMHADLEMVLY